MSTSHRPVVALVASQAVACEQIQFAQGSHAQGHNVHYIPMAALDLALKQCFRLDNTVSHRHQVTVYLLVISFAVNMRLPQLHSFTLMHVMF